MQTASCDSVITPCHWHHMNEPRWNFHQIRWAKVRTLTSEEREVQGFQMHLYLGSSLSSPKNVWFFVSKKIYQQKTLQKYTKNQHTDFGNRWICLPSKTTEIWASWLVWLRAKSAAFCAFGATFGAGPSIWMWATKKKLLLSIILVG